MINRLLSSLKRASLIDPAAERWWAARHGVSIERLEFMTKADFAQKRNQPDWLTWSLLTLDLFQKRVLGRKSAGSPIPY
jgi:hypothetical protein